MTTVLLVDDSPLQLKLGRLCLREAGFEVAAASSAEDALVLARARRPDAVLSDVLMGELDGFGLCRKLRETPELARIPVVLTSAQFSEQADRALAERVGANALVERTPDFHAEIAALKESLLAGAHQMPADDGSLRDQHVGRIAQKLSGLLDRAERSEKRYQALLDNANDAIAVLDEKGYVLEVNRAWMRIRGEPAERMIGKDIAWFSAPGHEDANTAAYRAAVRAGGPVEDTVPVRAADGGTRLMQFSTTAVELDDERVMMAIGRDVTEDFKARQALLDSEARMRSLMAHMPLAVWTMDAKGRTTYLSPSILKVTGFTAQELLAEVNQSPAFWTLHTHPEDLPRVTIERERFVRGEVDVFDSEYRWRAKSGEWIWLHNRASWRREASGELFCDGVFDNVTARHRLEESLCQAQKMEAVGQLAGGVAHDFNNILTVIIANANFLLSDLAKDDARREQADEIQQAAQRAVGLTRQLLLFSRKQVLKPERVSVDATVQQLCKMLGRLIGEDVALKVSSDPEPGEVLIDRGQLEQVVLNLVVNARDAMPHGGTLDLEIRNVAVPQGLTLSTGALPAGDYVKLTVRDSGCGIPLDLQARVFEPFFTTKAEGHGTGLGLSTVYAIVTEARGGLLLESAPGKGSAFSVYLLRIDADERRERPLPAFAHEKLEGNETILLVEDEEMVSSVATRILRSAGYRVLPARNAEMATRIVESAGGSLKLVLADVVMPGTNGPELVARLRALKPGLNALYMSGYSQHAALEAHQVQGSDPLVRKPFTAMDLLREVRAVLDAHAR
jgi:two-component system cell cycle sensor histidine kinase/response regulator CckA